MPLLIIDREVLSPEMRDEFIAFIEMGGQVSRHFIKRGVNQAERIAIINEEDQLLSIAVVKQPLESYRNRVFEAAGVPDKAEDSPLELGYLYTKPEFNGRGYCTQLISELVPTFITRPIFATTRNTAVIHILKKFGFAPIGNVYNDDLNLLIREPFK
jgi:predicted GNAT family N-acyltransferase